jgi:hypothetical protein
MALGRRQIVHIGVEVAVIWGAAVLGVVDHHVSRAAGVGVSQIMKCSLHGAQPRGPMVTQGTGAAFVAATLANHCALVQALRPRDALGNVWFIASQSEHRDVLQ